MNLNKLIKEKNFSLAEAAANCGVSLATLNKWRLRSAGRPGNLPSGEQGKNIELAFGISDFRALFPFDWPEVSNE